MTTPQFGPGSLVRARGREWIVLAGSDEKTLRLRPLSGSEEAGTVLYLPLEPEPVTEARFPPPTASQQGSQDGALLLRDALLLSLRRGAGPFRSFGQLGVEPRAYQLVPLLMALKLDPVRLLVADDVGIGKTIEAGLIAREMLDRGEVDRLAVLCPPHLVEQWVTELELRFNLTATAVTAQNARRLEAELPPTESIFSTHRYTVVSLDYIKSDKRRDEFLRRCPELVIVDEAHTCTSGGSARHQRYAVLKGLAESKTRHLVFLTATPHSGDELAYFKLLGLLDPAFERLAEAEGPEHGALRDRLSRHFVQRRRADIDEWQETRLFPKRELTELTYRLSGAWLKFFEDVLAYCAAVVEKGGGDERRRRLSFWGTLALMRCAASSPAAAVQALRGRSGIEAPEADDAEGGTKLEDYLFDGSGDSLPDDDVEPPVTIDDPALAKLVKSAESLAGKDDDPKLKVLADHLKQLVDGGFNPVVFCRFIATAHYLARHLAGRFKGVTVGVATGELTADERAELVEKIAGADRRLLIATDCLSEGINLQDHFDAVVHYDLSWNPTRHAQREGRVDRFGQPREVVRSTLIYGGNNPVDGAVLQVILRKAEKINEELGVPVPLPDDNHTLTEALMRAVMLKGGRQQLLDLVEVPEAKALEAVWKDAAETARKNRTVFAQRRLKPEEVLPEWKKVRIAVGGADEVRRFAGRALKRLGSGLEEERHGFRVALGALPEDVRERLEAEHLEGVQRIDFRYPPAKDHRWVGRSHPLVATLAETLLERSLAMAPDETSGDPAVLGRVGCWTAMHVEEQITVVLLRLRHQLAAQRGGSSLLVEEAAALAFAGTGEAAPLEGDEALALLVPDAAGDPPPQVRRRVVERALKLVEANAARLDGFAKRRAGELLADHRRVRDAAGAKGSWTVKALTPADVIGLFVILPEVH